MTIYVRVEADSTRPGRPDLRIASVVVRFPRYILAEVNTHRVFSRSFSSSRAIPVKRMIANIRRDPAMPAQWGYNRAGMQAAGAAHGWDLFAIKALWLGGMWIMTTLALIASWVGIHKQVVNRMVEPWAHVTGIITSTEWDNFFRLRCHKDADPTFQALAHAIYDALLESSPSPLNPGEWHLPFVDEYDRKDAFKDSSGRLDPKEHYLYRLKTVSAARCARASYDNFDGKRSTFEQDLALCQKLASSDPKHMSPFEHQATPADGTGFVLNFRGWKQQRMLIGTQNYPGWPVEMLTNLG